MAELEKRPAERVALAGLIVQLTAGILALIFYRLCGAATVWVMGWQALIGVIVWVMCLTHLRQGRLADAEAADWARLQAEREAGGAREQLFETDEIQAFSARNRLRVFEKYVAPGVAALVAILLGLTVLLAEVFHKVDLSQVVLESALISWVFILSITFVLFLVSMYATGLARQRAWRPVRAGASYMMLTVLCGAAAAVTVALGQFKFVRPDRVVAHMMLGIMALVAIEVLVNFILDFYRPRVEGVDTRTAYDSRLLGLLAEPGGIFKTMATTLDYQFGFRVSQTWFYRFLEQSIAPVILFMVLALYLLTCFVIVGPEQQGVIERLGKSPRVVKSGYVVKWPWPIERIYRFPANEVKTLELGHGGRKYGGLKRDWDSKHYEEEFETMVATPRQKGEDEGGVQVWLLVASVTVRYRVTDVEKWFYATDNPEELLESLCFREHGKFLASAKFFDVMGSGRLHVAARLREAMQAAVSDVPGADGEKGLGVEILDVGLEDVHPPVDDRAALSNAFRGPITAVQEKEIKISQARDKANKAKYEAKTAAAKAIFEAHARYGKRVHDAEADVIRFRLVHSNYAHDADMLRVFKTRTFLSALEEALVDARKVIVAAKDVQLQLEVELQEPVQMDVTDITFEQPVMGDEGQEKK